MTSGQFEQLYAILCDIQYTLATMLERSHEADGAEVCEHPNDQRIMTAARGRAWVCQQCGYHYTEAATH